MAFAFVLNPLKTSPKRRSRRKRKVKNRAGSPESPRGKQYRELVNQYGVVEAARKWRQIPERKKASYAANRNKKGATGNTMAKKKNTMTKAGFRKHARKKGHWFNLVKKHGIKKAKKLYSKNPKRSSRKRKRSYKRNRTYTYNRSKSKGGWYGESKRHSKAAKKGWRKRKRKGSYKKNMTTMTLGEIGEELFSMDTLIDTGIMAGGGIAAQVATTPLLNLLGQKNEGWMGALGDIGSSAALGWLVSMIDGEWGKLVLSGGMVAAITRVMNEQLKLQEQLASVVPGTQMGDYVTFGRQSNPNLSDYVTFQQQSQNQLGQFLPASATQEAQEAPEWEGGMAQYEDGLGDYYGVTAF